MRRIHTVPTLRVAPARARIRAHRAENAHSRRDAPMKRRTSANGDAAATDEHQDKRQRPSIDGSKKDDHDDMDVDEVRARDDARCDAV